MLRHIENNAPRWLFKFIKTGNSNEADMRSSDQKELGRAPWLLKYRSSKVFILFTVAMAVFTDIFLYAIIVPVLPFALSSRTGLPQSQVQSWVSILVAVYGGALAVFSPFCGWAADRMSSRRSPLVLGLLALAASTIMLNLGRSLAVLVVGRVLQGLSAAVVWVVGLALVADSVEKEEVAEMMGYVFLGLSLGYLLGPLLGGIVFERAGYNAVFAMAYVLIGLDIGLRLLLVEKKVARKWTERETGEMQKQQDLAIIASEKKAEHEVQLVNSNEDISTLPHQRQNQQQQQQEEQQSTNTPPPSLPPSTRRTRLPAVILLLRSPRLLTSLWATLVIATIMTQFDSVLPLHVLRIFNWTSLGSGLVFLPLVIPSFLGPVIGMLCDRYGNKWTCVLGFLLAVPCEACLRFVTRDSLAQKVLLCALLALLGLAMDFIVTPTMAEIMLVVVEQEEKVPGFYGARSAYASAYGLFNFSFALGALIGPVWAGFLNERAGWATMTWTFALLAGVSAVPAVVWAGGSIFEREEERSEGEGGGEA